VRKIYSFIPNDNFVNKALQFANRESHVVYLNPNSYVYPHGSFRHLLAFGTWKKLDEIPGENFEALKKFLKLNKDWVFGYFSYDLKNELEQLSSTNEDRINFPLLSFFVPKHIVFFNEYKSEIHSWEDPEKLFHSIENEISTTAPPLSEKIEIKQKISKEEYIQKITKLQQLILQGEIYETNFCMEYFAENVSLQPIAAYQKLNEISPMPFSCYLKLQDRYLLCASPERFIKKEQQQLISQPIKGTAKRDPDPKKDIEIRLALENSQKERSENIMIVDLVRNDLSHFAIPGSVKVEEVCALYSFTNVHQMISTVVAELEKEADVVEVIKKAFPMGSMTGAPKVRAMKLTDELEETARGLFSGAVGYFTPELDFDFNVVIRSILYNQETRYLSFQAGSAITYYADAEKEYEECEVKTAAIRTVLKS
jgi:para-aminobenzoate synthetase component 1